MIWPIVLLSLCSVLMTFLVVSPKDESEHDKCLKNIGKLEMELFPDLPKDLRWATWPTPEALWYGARHGVQSNFTQIFPQYNLASSVKSHARLVAPELDENESNWMREALTHSKDQWHPVGELH